LSEYIDKRTLVQAVPVASASVIETRFDPITERRRMSRVAVAALVASGITVAVVIIMMIVNTQQRNRDEALAQERAKTAAAQVLAQPEQQPSVIPSMSPSVPAIVASPSRPGPLYSRPVLSTTSIEIDVTSRLQNDELLRPYAVNVTVTGGIATLSGNVPDLDLKKRAEKLARAVKAVQSVVNDIVVRP
jgi:osmotically-inducible protein OsmY